MAARCCSRPRRRERAARPTEAGQAAQRLLLPGRDGSEVQEARHRAQTSLRNRGEIDAARDGRIALRLQLPGKPGSIVVTIDLARTVELAACKLTLDPFHHGVDAVVALRLYEWIDVRRVLRPGARDERPPRFGIRFVPDRKIPVNQFSEVVHDRILRCCERVLNYLTGNGAGAAPFAIVGLWSTQPMWAHYSANGASAAA